MLMTKEDYIEHFDDCFINELDDRKYFSLSLTEKRAKIINEYNAKTIIFLSLSAAAMGTAIGFVFYFNLFGCFNSLIASAAFVGAAGLTGKARNHIKGETYNYKNEDLADYINYNIYKENKKIKRYVKMNKLNIKREELVAKKLKKHLYYLFSSYEHAADLTVLGNLKEENKECICGNIKNHINQNAKLYKTFVPEFSEKISEL